MPLAPARPLLHALLGASLLAVTGTASVTQAQVLQAVVTYEGAVPELNGLDVLHVLPGVSALVVEGPAAALTRAARTTGVRGVSPDVAVSFTTTGGTDAADAVRAWKGLRGAAGTQRAGEGVRIAVVDTGVSDTPALHRASGRLVDAVDTSTTRNRGPFTDGYGHGTFMASVIAGGQVDGSAVGVAPGSTVLVVRVAQADGSTRLSQVVRGLDWVARNSERVDVANLSLSHTRPSEAYGADPLTEAVEAVRDAGVVVVVSAGNDPSVVGDPGFTPRALTVGAADLTVQQPDVAPFSGSAVVAGVQKPDLVASGVGVLGALPEGSVIARKHEAGRRGGLWRGSGTSQATAVTSGAVALLLADRPQATPGQVKAALRRAAADLRGDRDGAGLLTLGPVAADAADDPAYGPGDPTGEGRFDAGSWSANSWSANSWSANSWSANSWSANSWSWLR